MTPPDATDERPNSKNLMFWFENLKNQSTRCIHVCTDNR